MAKIVYGFGSSHGPLLATPPERWDLRAADDRKNPEHPFRGRIYTFPELVEARRGEKDFEKESSLETRQRSFERNVRAMDRLAEKLAEVNPDIIVVVGDDQHEWFHDDIQPSFTVYCGDQVINSAIDPEILKTKSPGIALAMSASHPPQDQSYPVPAGLATAIIEQAVADEFDIAVSMEQRSNARGIIGVGHAVGFVYRRIVQDRPVPVVPILLNTYFRPNRPTAKRCYQFGQSVGRAIAGWNGPNAGKRVAICASGGISHFVVDEDFDTRMLTAIKNRDTKTIFAEPENMFLSGTSETKNWITVAGILSATDLQMNLIDYVPSCRSEAGTGCGMGFATWE
jgi:Catalytic LigB subunit of aromatic ring-opening dioxygenase